MAFRDTARRYCHFPAGHQAQRVSAWLVRLMRISFTASRKGRIDPAQGDEFAGQLFHSGKAGRIPVPQYLDGLGEPDSVGEEDKGPVSLRHQVGGRAAVASGVKGIEPDPG